MGKGKKRPTPTQTYDNQMAKGSIITLSFNHDPAKNTGGQILKYGTGYLPTGESNPYNTPGFKKFADGKGKVRGGFLYYLGSNGRWYPTWYDYYNTKGYEYIGQGSVLGVALGRFGEYDGTPEEVGMLIQGVTTVSVFGAMTYVGQPVYGAYNDKGRMSMTLPASGSTGRIEQKLGTALGQQLNASGYYETIVFFRPETPHPLGCTHFLEKCNSPNSRPPY